MKRNQYVAILAFLAVQSAFGASFKCVGALSRTERAICDTPWLSAKDEELAAAYHRAVSQAQDPDEVVARQQVWVAKERDPCATLECLVQAYSERLAELKAVVRKPSKANTATSDVSFDAFEAAFKEQGSYVGAMLTLYMRSPEVTDVAKIALATQVQAILINTGIMLAYEKMILSTKGAVCSSSTADLIPEKLRFADATRAPIMYKPGSLVYVNAGYFRDLCVLYGKAPKRVADLYNQQISQIKSFTGGRNLDELDQK